MPKIVEILAPSGTGKTTLYKGLQKKWNPSDSWAVYHDFRYQRKALYKFPKDYVLALSRKLDNLKKLIFAEEIQYKKRTVHQKPNEKIFYKNYPEFCDTAMELLLKHNAVGFNCEDKRFINVFFLFETIEHLQAISNYTEDTRKCIMDEGLVSRLMHLNSPTFNNSELNRYLEKMPVPSEIIYLKSEADNIVERILSRKKTATVHENLSKDDIYTITKDTQKLMERTLTILSEKGANVHWVNADKNSDELIEDVYNIVTK